MTKQEQIILRCLEANLASAKTKAMRQFAEKQLADFRKSCEPKPKHSRPAWVDRF